jgi:pimeloyl-ACP methyl ester carboxylesterase
MAPKVQKKITMILPNSRFELIADSGHVVYLEQPARFFDLVLGLMRSKSV